MRNVLKSCSHSEKIISLETPLYLSIRIVILRPSCQLVCTSPADIHSPRSCASKEDVVRRVLTDYQLQNGHIFTKTSPR